MPARRNHATAKWGNSKPQYDAGYSTVLIIARRLLVDKDSVRSVAKDLRLSPKLVQNIRDAKSNKTHWVNAIAELGRQGLIDG